MHMMAAWTKMRPRAIPSPKIIPYLKVGCYVTLKTVALIFVYLFNNVNLNSVPTQKGGLRKAREATRGVMIDRMTKAKGRRLPVTVAEENLRPHDPLQAAKFASEVGVIVRGQVPILTL